MSSEEFASVHYQGFITSDHAKVIAGSVKGDVYFGDIHIQPLIQLISAASSTMRTCESPDEAYQASVGFLDGLVTTFTRLEEYSAENPTNKYYRDISACLSFVKTPLDDFKKFLSKDDESMEAPSAETIAAKRSKESSWTIAQLEEETERLRKATSQPLDTINRLLALELLYEAPKFSSVDCTNASSNKLSQISDQLLSPEQERQFVEAIRLSGLTTDLETKIESVKSSSSEQSARLEELLQAHRSYHVIKDAPQVSSEDLHDRIETQQQMIMRLQIALEEQTESKPLSAKADKGNAASDAVRDAAYWASMLVGSLGVGFAGGTAGAYLALRQSTPLNKESGRGSQRSNTDAGGAYYATIGNNTLSQVLAERNELPYRTLADSYLSQAGAKEELPAFSPVEDDVLSFIRGIFPGYKPAIQVRMF
jgi:hypothetical protein